MSLDTLGITGRKRTLHRHLVAGVLLIACCVLTYPVFIEGTSGPLQQDFGQMFLSKMQQQLDALHAGQLLTWDPIAFGGTPFWPLPYAAPAYPPLLASLWLRGTIGGLDLALALHLLFGAVGVYVLVLRLSGRHFAALLGGVLFLRSRFTHHIAFVQPHDAMALAWFPWTLWLLHRAVHRPRWALPAFGAGAAFSAVVWAGGYVVLPWGLYLMAGFVAGSSLRPPWGSALRRGACVLAVFGLAFALLSAGKLLPTVEWITLTDRASGVTEQFATREKCSPEEALQWAGQEGWIVMGLAVLGFLAALVRRRVGPQLFFTGAVLLFVALSCGFLQVFLYRYAPGFRFVRDARRVWLIMPAVLPVAAALTTAWLADRWRLSAWTLPAAAAALVLAMAADEHVHQDYRTARLHRLDEYVGGNPIYQDLARRAAVETRFRVHDAASTRPYLVKTPDVIRSTLRIEGLASVLGIFSIPRYDAAWLAPSAAAPARYWGVMNCRYVTSPTPLDQPGLTLAGRFNEDPRNVLPGFDGPLLYRNELELPRAALLEHVALLVGGDVNAVMSHPRWPSRLCAVAQMDAAELARLDDATLRRFDVVLSFADAGCDAALEARLAALGARHRRDDGHLEGSLEWLATAWAGMRNGIEALPDPPVEFNGISVELPVPSGRPQAGQGGRWLLLAETCSVYPGWTATVDGLETPILRANGVTTALALPGSARRVELRYVPPGLFAGLLLTAAGVLLGLGVLVAARRGAARVPPRRQRAAPPAPVAESFPVAQTPASRTPA